MKPDTTFYLTGFLLLLLFLYLLRYGTRGTRCLGQCLAFGNYQPDLCKQTNYKLMLYTRTVFDIIQ